MPQSKKPKDAASKASRPPAFKPVPCTAADIKAVDRFLSRLVVVVETKSAEYKEAMRHGAGSVLAGQCQYWDHGAKMLRWARTVNRQRKADHA